jgi:hypothetical protein
VKARLPYYGMNKCKRTEQFLRINRTSYTVIMIRNIHVNRHCNFWRQKCDYERSRKISIIQKAYSTNTAHVECENENDTSNNWVNWNHLKVIQETPEKDTGKA